MSNADSFPRFAYGTEVADPTRRAQELPGVAVAARFGSADCVQCSSCGRPVVYQQGRHCEGERICAGCGKVQ